MKQNVLVFPCGSEIGLEVLRSLQYSTHFNLIGGSSLPDHGSFVYADYIEDIPFVDDDNFISALNNIIRSRTIKYIFPAHDSVVLRLAKAKADGSLKCEVITSSLETCEIARSKKNTYETLKDVIAVPKLYELGELSDTLFPLFLKPDVGQGSKGTHKALNRSDIEYFIKNDPSLLIMEYLPGGEYTIDCFTNNQGQLIFCKGRIRNRVSNGISVNSSIIEDDRFLEIAQKINNTLRFTGVWFFQLKERENGDLVLMEIAPRIAGTMGLQRARGVNLALLSLFDAEGKNLDLVENDFDIIIDRALQNSYKHDIKYKHVYLDFDDTVIINGKVNIQLMAFVFQCINIGIKIHLITRHKLLLEDTLEKFRLVKIFDEIIWIQDETEKHTCIKYKEAIFIDDSHAERKKVLEAHDIPVFDPHAVEGLMKNI